MDQTEETAIYLFALTGEESCSRLRIFCGYPAMRQANSSVISAQEVKRHVQDIVDYLDGEHVLFPHAVIVAFSSKVRFTSSRGPKVRDGLSTAGELTIQLPDKPGSG